MEGFVFDLQRFTTKNWTSILNSDDDNNEYYFDVNDDSEYLTIRDYSAGTTSNLADDAVRVLVQRTGSSEYRVNLVQCVQAGAISYSNSSSKTLQLNFDGVNPNKTFKFSVKKLECLNLQGTVQEGNDGFDVITASVKNSGSVTFETPDKTVNIKGESTGTVIYGGMAYSSLNTIYILAGASVGTVNFGSGSGKTLNLAAGASVGDLEGGGTGTVNLADGATVAYTDAQGNTLIKLEGAGTGGTCSVIGNTSNFNLISGSFTLYGGKTYQYGSNATGAITVAGTGSVHRGNTNAITVSSGNITIVHSASNSGDVYVKSGANVKIGSAGQTYTSISDCSLSVSGTTAKLTNGGVTLDSGESITVSYGNNTSTIEAGASMSIDVTVDSTNGTYVISGLDDGKTVTIDNVAYTYDSSTKRLLNNGVGWKLTGDSIGFTISNGTDTFISTYGSAYPPDLTTDLSTIMSGMESAGTLCFNAAGKQQDSESGAAYKLVRDSSGKYTLTSTANATSDITIDTSGLTGLTVDLTAGSGKQTLKVNSTTTLSSDSKLGAGDKITDGTNTLLTAADTTTLAMAAGPDISVSPGASVTVPATSSIKTTGSGTYTVNGISVTTSGDSTPFVSIIPDAETATTLTINNLADSEIFTVNTAGNSYTVGGQTFKNVSQGVEISGAGTATLTGTESVTVGTTVIQPLSGDGVQVTVTDSKYTISDIEDGERVSIGGRKYLYRADSKFLEEYNDTYENGIGDGFILNQNNAGSITFNSDGTLDTSTATAMPSSLADESALARITQAMPVGNTYYFNAAGGRAASTDTAAYTLEKKSDGYVLKSTANSTGELSIDASGVTNLTVDLTAGNGQETLKVNNATTLSSGSKLGAGDKITNGTTTILTAEAASTIAMAAGPDISLAPDANVTVPADTSIKTTGDGTYTVNGISVTTSGDSVPFIIIIPDADDATTLTVNNLAASESFTVNTAGKNYTIGGQTFKNVSAGVEINGAGTAILTGEESVTVGTADTVIKNVSGDGIQVTLTDGKYTIGDIDDGERVSIGGTTYLYRGNTGFLEELSGNDGTGRGYRLNPAGDNATIAFTSTGVLDESTATVLPGTMAGNNGEFAIICSLVEENLPFQFKADGTRALSGDDVAYTLTKSGSSYTLTSTDKATGNITLDASGVTNLTVDLTAGSSNQTLKVNNTTTLSSGSKLGAGDKLTDGTNTLLTAVDATTLSMTAGPDISVASGAMVTVPATPGIKTTGDGIYTVNGITVTTSGDTAPFISIKPDADDANATTLTFDNLAEGETFTANTAEKNYTVGGQTFKKVSAGVEINGAGTATLTGTESVTVPGTEGDTIVQSVSGDGIKVTITSGKYSISDLDNGEKVSIGGKTYLYRANTGFLEEMSGDEGTGRGYRLKPAGNNATIAFTNAGVLDTNTADALPGTMAGDAGQFAIVCSLVEENLPFQFKADGTRAVGDEPVAYTLTKSGSGYTLTSTDNANTDITLDTSGLTGLTVDLTAGTGAQTLKVDSTTTLSSGSKLGAGDTITDGTNTLLTSNAATTLSVAAGPDISVASGANVTVPTSPTSTGIKTAGNGNYTVNGISVTTSGDTEPFIIIIPDAENATTLTLDNMAAGESFTANTAGNNYTVGGQTFKNVSAGVEINGAGTATLTGEQSVTVGTADTVIKPVSGNGVQVTLTDGKYTLSGLDEGEKVSIGGKTYLYRANTKFLEEYNGTYPDGSGDGFILNSDGSITFNSNGTLDTTTATTMPSSLGDVGALDKICRAMPVGNTYYFKADGTRADSPQAAAYTLKKTSEGYELASTENCTGELPIDARGLTNLTVDFSKGSGQQALKVDSKTTLSPNTKLGAGDTITDGNNILVKASGDGGTVTVEGGKVTLNSGTFEGTGTNTTPISATAPVTIDGVTFAAGAAGTFTNGTPDTFEVSKGQATIDKTFNGTEVKTKGVTYTVAPPTEATFDGATNEVTDFKSGKLTFTATDDKPYTIGGQTISDGNGEVLTFIAKDNKTYLSGTTNNHGGISLKPGESITVTDENGNNPTTIAPLGDKSTVNVSVASGGKYTLSGLDDGEKVSIGDKTYLYRKDTQFLEEFNKTYPEGSGDGFILKNGSISFNNDGTLDEGTATSMPSSLAEEGALDIINRAMPEGNTYYFNEQGGRAESDKTAAYTLEKTTEKSVLKSTENSTGELPIDARGLTKLEVDFSTGSGKQTLDVDENTELVDGSKLGAGSSITYKGKPYVSFTGDTPVLLAPGKPLTISDLTPGTTVDVAPGMEVNAGNAVYKAADKGTPLTIGKSTDGTGTIGVQSGTLEAAEGTAYTMLDKEGNKGDVVTVTGKAEITTDATGKAAVTGLDVVGEKVVIKNSEGQETTYEVIAENLIKKVDSEGNITHWTVTDSSQLTLTDEEGTTQGVDFKAALVATKDKTAEGETYLTANGVSTEAGKDDVAAVLTKDGNKKTLEVSKDMDLSVQLTGDTLTVKDKGTNTTYNLTDTTEISASGATFTTAEGVVSDVTGTLTVKEGELDTKDGSDKAKYTLSKEGTKVNFQPGSPLSGTTVTTAKGNNIVIKESDNTNTTTVDSQGNITGVDGNAEITGLPVGATVTTTGSGTLALNGKTWEVKGDSDGTTFTVSSDGISGITGLAEGATLSTADRVSDLTINGCTITRAKNGLSYTAGSAGKGEFGLSHQGDSLRTADGTAFTVDKSQNGVSVGTDGKLTGLTDGEKVTVTTEDGTKLVYEVTGNTLVTTQTAPDGTITTMTSILAEGETGFAIEPGAMKAANGSTDASQILANADINAGSTEISPVNTVTNGMLLDKKGHATADIDKAIAEITIKDDGALKYEATKEVRQTIKIGTGSTAEWDITTTNKADTIDYAGSHDVSITSRDGNDKITISGTGDAVVRGESGRNTIIHTGTGDATIVGGSGNDTITSTHADDTITGGEGKDTFILTNVESHVTDFTYGQDKAIITSSAGALDPYKVKVTTDGNISYTGAGAVSGSLNVDGQGYGDFYAATLADVDGHNKLNVGWTGAQGGMIDASSLTDKLLLIGNSEGSSDSLIGGQSRDTIVAGNGASSLWGGAGRDLIESNDEASHTIFFLAGDGNDTVTGFTAYGEDNADTLNFLGQGVTSVKHTDKGIQLYHGSDKMTLTGNFDANTMIQWENGNDHGIAKIGKTGEDNKFTYNEEVTSYLGSRGKDTLTIGADDGNAEIWLDGSHGANYDSVEILDASSTNGTVILAGGEGKQTITGGKGNSSLWGGTGSATDVLNGGSGEDVFYYGKEEGNDIVNNASADDKVMLYNLSLGDLKAADIDTNKVTITQQNGQTLTINGRAGEFTLSDGSTWTADYSTKTWNRVK